MRRVYRTKENACKERITIPMPQALLEKLTHAAAAAGKLRTTFAREIIEKALKK